MNKNNHGGLMNSGQFADWQAYMKVEKGAKWNPFATVTDVRAMRFFLAEVPFLSKGIRRYRDDKLQVPAVTFSTDREILTQAAFGKILDDLAKGDSPLRHVS